MLSQTILRMLSQTKREIVYTDNRNKSFNNLTKQQQNHKQQNRLKHDKPEIKKKK